MSEHARGCIPNAIETGDRRKNRQFAEQTGESVPRSNGFGVNITYIVRMHSARQTPSFPCTLSFFAWAISRH